MKIPFEKIRDKKKFEEKKINLKKLRSAFAEFFLLNEL
jgi:hypothetical protein